MDAATAMKTIAAINVPLCGRRYETTSLFSKTHVLRGHSL
jgi:hypothetical protein